MEDLDKDLDAIREEFSCERPPPEAESVDEPMDLEEECVELYKAGTACKWRAGGTFLLWTYPIR